MCWSNAPPKEACFADCECKKQTLHVLWAWIIIYGECFGHLKVSWTKSHYGSWLGIFLPMLIRLLFDSDWRFNNLCNSHLQTQFSELYHITLIIYFLYYWIRVIAAKIHTFSLWSPCCTSHSFTKDVPLSLNSSIYVVSQSVTT